MTTSEALAVPSSCRIEIWKGFIKAAPVVRSSTGAMPRSTLVTTSAP